MAEITGGRKGRVASRQQIPGARRRTVSSSCAYFMWPPLRVNLPKRNSWAKAWPPRYLPAWKDSRRQ